MTSRIRVFTAGLTLGFIAMLPAVSAAQSHATFGVKAGVNVATLSFSDSSDEVKSKVGAVAGVFVGKSVNDNVGVQAEALFSQKGAKDKSSDFKINLGYIDVPVLAVLGSSAKETSVQFLTGPQMSFNTKAESSSGGTTVDFKDEVKSTDFGWVVGARVGQKRFHVDLRYVFGLTNIAKDDDDSAKNRVLSVTVGVKLGKQ